jgi:hypothetical protein
MNTVMSWQPWKPGVSRKSFCGMRGSLTTLASPGLRSGTSTTEILLCARWPFSSKRTHSLPYSDSAITLAVYEAM